MDINSREIYEKFIIIKLASWNSCYTKIHDDTVLKCVYELYKNNKYVDCDDGLYLNYAGVYAKHNARDDLSESFFLMAIEKEHIKSIHNLALLYSKQKKFELAEKYYLMAAEKGHTSSMYNLALWYARRRRIDLSRYYHVMGAINHHERSIKKANEIIKCTFNLDDSVKLINVLNDHNYNILNDVLKFIVVYLIKSQV